MSKCVCTVKLRSYCPQQCPLDQCLPDEAGGGGKVDQAALSEADENVRCGLRSASAPGDPVAKWMNAYVDMATQRDALAQQLRDAQAAWKQADADRVMMQDKLDATEQALAVQKAECDELNRQIVAMAVGEGYP